MSWFSFKSASRDGFHDAALVEFSTKQDIVEVVVRELVQNSLDARVDPNRPVKVIFEIGEVNSGDIPDWIGLKNVFNLSKRFNERSWPGAFASMNVCFNSKSLSYLKISDSNTSGLSQKTKKDSKEVSTWDACVLAESQSVKGSTSSRGSFGIGKNAAFAFSSINTVFYSSWNGNESLFAGVSKLGGHSEGDVHYSSKKIFHGKPIIPVFNHTTESFGLSQTIIGIELSVERDLHVLLELYLYKHYILSLYENNLEIEIRDVRNPGFNFSISATRKIEFIDIIRRRLIILGEKLARKKSYKNDLANIALVINSISEVPVSLENCYTALLKNELYRKYIDYDLIPESWKLFCSKTKLSYFSDSTMSANIIFHFRNGMFIDSKTFSSTYPVPIAIIHNVDDELSSYFSNFETFSHDKWLKGLLKDRVQKNHLSFHEELFDFQRLLPKLLMIEIIPSSIVERESITEQLVNNLLTGDQFNLSKSKDGLRTLAIGGRLESQTIVRDGIVERVRKPSQPKEVKGKSKRGLGLSRPPRSGTKRKLKRPLISSTYTGQAGTRYSFKFIDFPEGEYRLNRQGLNQMCELNLIEVVKKSEKVLVHTDGEYIVIVNSVDSTFTLDVIVDDQNVTQWKLTN